MSKCLWLFVLLVSFISSEGKKLQVVPKVGFQYFGFSYLSKDNLLSDDFKKSSLEFEGAIGLDVKYKLKRWTHVLSLQNALLGPSFSTRNMYADKGITPTLPGHRHATITPHALLSYALQRESRKLFQFTRKIRTSFYYSAGIGVGFNRTKWYYNIALQQYTFSATTSTNSSPNNYYNLVIDYRRAGIGLFMPVTVGLNFYNKRNKNFLTFQAFWNQGLKKMAEYNIRYRYGYYNYPQYQRQQEVTLKTRGTVFGVTMGVPIRILK